VFVLQNQVIRIFCLAMGPVITTGQNVAINVGGGVAGGYKADVVCGGRVWTDATIGPGMWTTLKYDPKFSCDIPMANGYYEIRLKLVEPNKTGSGQRKFRIAVNGLSSDLLDLFVLGGGVKKWWDLMMPVLVTDGHVRIVLTGTVGNAVLSGIELEKIERIRMDTTLKSGLLWATVNELGQVEFKIVPNPSGPPSPVQ